MNRYDQQNERSTLRRPRRLWRRRAIAMLAAVLIVGGLRLMLLKGLVKPVRVVGGSMAGELLGDHYRVACGDCGLVFRCDADDAPLSRRVVCPNCGYAENGLSPDQLRRGDRVLIDTLGAALREPRRWELFALSAPDDSARLSVKRVVGLPRERPAIRHGDLYVNDSVVRKTLPQQRRLAVLVYDHDHRPRQSANLPPRWQGDAEDSLWWAEGGDFVHPGTNPDEHQVDWLTYRHLPCLPPPVRRSEESPVLDAYSYNQNVSRRLSEVVDLMLVCRLKMSTGLVRLLAHDGREALRIELDGHHDQIRLLRDGRIVATADSPALAAREISVELALCDQQVLLAIDRTTLVQYAYRPARQPLQPTSRPLAIGAVDAPLRVGRLQVFRDVYYLHHLDSGGDGRKWALGRPLADDEYLVLGDNAPISDDSRLWEAGVAGKSLVGRVLRYPGSSRP